MPPPVAVEYQLTPGLAARAADEFVRARRADLRRKFRKPFAAFALYAALCVALLLGGYLIEADDWFLTAATALAAVAAGFVVLMLLLQGLGLLGLAAAGRRSRLAEPYTAAPDPTVRWTFTAAGFETRLGERTRAVPWAGVRSFLATPSFWVIGVTGGPDLFLPRAALTDEAREVVRGKLGAPVSASAGSGTA